MSTHSRVNDRGRDQGTQRPRGDDAMHATRAANTTWRPTNSPMLELTAAFAEDFKAKTGQYPVFVQGHTVHGIWGLGEALRTLKLGPDGRLTVKQLAFAMEKVRFDTSMGEIAMRAEDHQALLPLVVSVVSKDAKYKVDGTDMGFKPVRLAY